MRRLSSHAESRQKEDPFLHHKVRAGDRPELREGAGGVEGELHVPGGAKEGLRTYLPNRRSLLSYSSSNALHRTLMCWHVVLTSCSVSVNVVCQPVCTG